VTAEVDVGVVIIIVAIVMMVDSNRIFLLRQVMVMIGNDINNDDALKRFELIGLSCNAVALNWLFCLTIEMFDSLGSPATNRRRRVRV
jgi:hypothetical protein